MNVCALSGRLVRDPELRSTNSGKSVTNFTIAVNRQGVRDKSDFIDCVAWEGRAEFINKYFSKGMKIEVNGCITTRTYEKDGQTQKTTELLVATADFAEKKSDSSNDSSYISIELDAEEFEPVEDDDDLPF